MVYALVGTIGAAVTGTLGSTLAPAWGTGESRTAGNLLVMWACNDNSNVSPFNGLNSAGIGWSEARSQSGVLSNGSAVSIIYKIATGGEAAPGLNAGTGVWSAQLAEFSGNATVTPVDQVSTQEGTTSPLTATCPSADAASGELLLFASTAEYSTAATRTLTDSLNNGATAVSTNNNSTSIAGHFNFGYGITTSHASADADTWSTSVTTHLTEMTLVIASFKLAVPGANFRFRGSFVPQIRASHW